MNEHQLHGGTWVVIDDDSRISYQVDPDEQGIQFNFFGPVELCVGMSTRVMSRLRGLLGDALAEVGSSVDQCG